jgi:serine/threonine protein kinase
MELRLENSIVDERYLVEKCLSRGSYAEIFRARDIAGSGDDVIIKALNTSLQGTPDADLEQTLVENFQNEALALDKVRHPHIIRRLGHGTAADLEGTPFHYLVLENMPGGDMLTLCRAHPLALADTLNYFAQVADALSYAHSQKVIHRDIKPNNLLLSSDRRTVKIADFGVAKIAPGDGAEITRVGTNIYAPPEHHPDNQTGALEEPLTPSADIYSLAKSVYTAMTGRAPHQFARQPITKVPPNLASEPFAADLLAVLEKATCPRVANRYQSAAEFREDFSKLWRYADPSGATDQLTRELDPEATLVRSRSAESAERLAARKNGPAQVAGTVGDTLQPAPRPDFRAPAASSYLVEAGRPEKARIVIELPKVAPPLPKPAPAKMGLVHLSPAVTEAMASTAAPDPSAKASTPVFAAESSAAIKPGEAARTPSEKRGGLASIEPGTFDNSRVASWYKWLRVVFIVCLSVALMGFVVSTYYHFANPSYRMDLPWSGGSGAQAHIGGASNVNIRSEPSAGGDILATLPERARVQILESRGNWVRVKVIDWPGGPPDQAPDGGWVDRRYVRPD